MASHALVQGARGTSVVIVGQVLRICLQFCGVIVLSRLLTPSDFGLVALVAIFLAMGELLRDFGLPTAALQAPTLSQGQASNFFWANALLGLSAGIALAASAPLMVLLFNEPKLAQIVPVMACTLVLNGFQAQLGVRLSRQMRFATLALTEVGTQAIGLCVAIVSALCGLGYWSLVIQAVFASASLLAVRLVCARWLPGRPRRGQGSREMFRSGSQLGLAQVLTFAASNADTIAIGTMWPASQVGYYNRAFQLYTLPKSAVLDPLTPVVLPTINSTVTTSGMRSHSMLLRVQFALAAPLGLVYAIAAGAAPALIPVVLGDQWTPSVPVFTALAVGGLFAAFGNISYWTFLLENQSSQLMRLHLVTKPLAVILVVAAVPYGVTAVGIAFAMSVALSWPINLFWLSRSAGQDSMAFFRSGLRVVFPALVSMGVARASLHLTGTTGTWTGIAFSFVAGLTSFFVVLAAIPNGIGDIKYLGAIAAMIRRRSLGSEVDGDLSESSDAFGTQDPRTEGTT